MSAINFDANQVKPDAGLSPVPRGNYKVMIVDSELKPTKNGAGEIIKLSLQIIEGAFQGKTILTNINWKNKNATAQNIGHAQLSAICHATGMLIPQDTVQLHNLPMGVEVALTPDGKYNDVKAFITAAAVDTMPAPVDVAPAAPQGPVGMAPAPQAAQAPAAPAPVAQAPAFPQVAPQQPQAAPVAQTVTPQQAPVQPAVATSPSNAPAGPPPQQAPVDAPTAAPVAEVQQPAPTAATPPWIVAQQEAAAQQ